MTRQGRLLTVLLICLVVQATTGHGAAEPQQQQQPQKQPQPQSSTTRQQSQSQQQQLDGRIITTSIQNDGPNHQHQHHPPPISETDEAKAYELLVSMGLGDLCHPDREDLLFFPHCRQGGGGEEGNTHVHRAASEQQYNRYYNYEDSDEGQEDDSSSSPWNFNAQDVVLAAVCVIVSSMAAGLTLGLLSLDPLVLLIKSRAGDEVQAAQALALLPVIQKRHLLLVTLLLLNTASSEALPVVLHGMAPDIVVVVLSVLLILVFGEILPSAIFMGQNQIALASSMTGLVKVFMILLYPLAYPIARLLDCIVHEEPETGARYTRNELATLVRVQFEEIGAAKERRMQALQELGQADNSPLTPEQQLAVANSSVRDLRKQMKQHGRQASLVFDEVLMMEGALSLKSKCVADLCVSYRKVFAVPLDMVLNEENIVHIFASGFSRVPVYQGQDNDPTRICGILMTRQLILVNSHDNKRVADLPLHVPHCIPPGMDLMDLVNLFQTGCGPTPGNRPMAGHMAIVCARPEIGNQALNNEDRDDGPEGQAIPPEAGLMGIITLEDVLEALLQEPIHDEMDVAGRRRPTRSFSTSSNTTQSNEVRRVETIDEGTAYQAML